MFSIGDEVRFLDNVLDGNDGTRERVALCGLNMGDVYIIKEVHQGCIYLKGSSRAFDKRRLEKIGGPW